MPARHPMRNLRSFVQLINLGLLGLVSLCSLSSFAETLAVNVNAPDGATVPGTVVILEPKNAVDLPVPTEIAIMDQVNRQFKPHILPVQTNTQVRFPNSDSIQHHVYSFSDAKVFELPLYKSNETSPMTFDNPGVVELGCNIHDWMLGYIVVLDTPYFSQANADGIAEIEAPKGKYQLRIWHPRIQDESADLLQGIELVKDTSVSITLKSALLPSHEEFEQDDEFSDYDE